MVNKDVYNLTDGRNSMFYCHVVSWMLARRGVRRDVKLEFHDAHTDTDILAGILADTSDARFPEVIPMTSWTTRRHSRDDPREDVGEDVGVGSGVRVVKCQLKRGRGRTVLDQGQLI